MNWVNKVELSGTIREINTTPRGGCFIKLEQINNIIALDGTPIEKRRLFEMMLSSDKAEIIKTLQKDQKISIRGVLTTFLDKRVTDFKLWKTMIEVNELTILE
ncbi:MAG: hypothetical protein LBG49_01875 [Mycoplasmataceae bacterium]|nr:hypothetical protein [Mycoplasmataceae bacterium]